jgi:superfamily II DNA or RNA helicase
VQDSHTAFSAGQHVVVRDERWIVLHAESFDRASLLKLRGADLHNRDDVQTVVAPFDCVQPVTRGTATRQRSRRSVLALAASAIAEAVPWHQCWTAGRARIDLRAWQLEPAAAAVTGSMRILLADAAGLGKTIQAGLIISELRARALVDRVLVLTPASLRDQWADELSSRFRLTPIVLDHGSLATMAASLPPDVNPWSTAPLIISSIDLVKRGEIRTALDGVPFDLLVVDEAHHVTRASDRGLAVAGLASRTSWVVLITATPHSGDDHAFAFLTGLGDVAGDELQVFRRLAPPDGTRLVRRSRLFAVRPTGAERALLNATAEYVRALGSDRRGPGARLVASVIARRAASSAHAAARTLARRLALLRAESAQEQQACLPWEDEGTTDDEVSDAVLSVAGLADEALEIAWLQRLLALAHEASDASSKLGVLRRLLRRTKEQVLVFSEFRDVVLQTATALSDLTSVATLHGGMAPRERHRVVQSFNTGATRTLVATDAAGEGLNLQARCRLVVNIELPWMPRRLEQRVGRVDRIGQTRRVHAIDLVHRDSFEGTVVARLERRRASAMAREQRTRACDARPPAVDERRLRNLAHGHRWQGDTAYCARPKAAHGAAVLVFAVPLLDGLGGLVQRDVVGLRVSMGHRRPLSRHVVRALARSPTVDRTLALECQRRLSVAHRAASAAGQAIERRATALAERLDCGARGQAWQGSLFDRRAEQAAERRAGNVAAVRRHLRQRCERSHALQHVSAGEPRLVAAWLDVL